MSDRIKLAEAMGWKRVYDEKPKGMVMDPPDGWWKSTDGEWSVALDFDPFTDANDDYAVLKWIRTKDAWKYNVFTGALGNQHSMDYQIGDYARAALKVLASEAEDE